MEFMPLENGGSWAPGRVVSGREVRERIEARWPMEPDPTGDSRAPASRFRFLDGKGSVGFIDAVTAPFCSACSRLRLTADGQLRVCLHDSAELDLKALLRGGASDAELDAALRRALAAKRRGGAIGASQRRPAQGSARTMHQIGG